MPDASTVITDRAAIIDTITSTLSTLDNLRASSDAAHRDVDAAHRSVEEAEQAYLAAIAAALGTGWFTVEGLNAQGHHVTAKKLPKNTATEPPEIDRDNIPALIASTLSTLDEHKEHLRAATQPWESAQHAAAAAEAHYGDAITKALATGWFTVDGLNGQGHTPPKKKRGARKPAEPAPSSPPSGHHAG